MTQELYQEFYMSCYNSIEYFASEFFSHIIHKKSAPFQQVIYDDLLDPGFYACEAPRGHAKSTIGLVIKPIHYAIFHAIGDVSLLSASESFVINEIVRVVKREFESNEKLKYFFGDMKTSKWSETYFVIKKHENLNGGGYVAFEAGGIGGQLRGGRRGLICLDDLETNETVESEEQREKLRNRINKELIPKLLPGGQLTYFGTPISPLCYLRHIMKNEKGWKKRSFDCYVDGIEGKGHELWPDMMPHEELQRRKAIMGTNAFQAEYRCNPISEATAAIKEDMIQVWDDLPSQMNIVMAVDPAYSEDPKADPKVCSVIGCDYRSNRYLITYIRNRRPQGEFIDAVLNLFLTYKNQVIALGIPKGGGDSEFWNSFLRRCRERDINPPLIELKNTFTTASGEVKKNKKARAIAALQPLFESGKYFIHGNHVEAREELLLLNPKVDQEHDDIIDTLAYAEQLMVPAYSDEEVVDVGRGEPSMAGKSSGYGIED